MSTVYCNRGAPHRRTDPFMVYRDGAWVEDYVVRRGELFRPTDEELVRIAYKLASAGAVAREPEARTEARVAVSTVNDYYTGGGWCEIPGVGRVRGMEAAIEALEASDGEDQ